MDKLFKNSEARKLIKAHLRMASDLNGAVKKTESLKKEIESASKSLAFEQASEILATLSIDELNRDKKGIRVKNLKDAGYRTYWDVFRVNEERLAQVYGISEDSAKIIKKLVDEEADLIIRNTKIRLNADKKTNNSSKLVSLIYRYIRMISFSKPIQDSLSFYNTAVEQKAKSLRTASNPIIWLFLSDVKKKNANDAYTSLKNYLDRDYGKTTKGLLAELSRKDDKNENHVWENFERNPIIYINTLEKVVPQLVSKADQYYGLPEVLAKDIGDFEFSKEGLNCELRRYQEWGVKYILHQQKVLLGDEMGLGKTIQAIAVMVALKNQGCTHFAVVCPLSVTTNWCREIEKHSILKAIKIHGNDKEQQLKEWIENGGVAVTTYETTAHICLEDVFRFAILVVDEAHYVKNPGATRTIHVKQLCSHADRLLFMTGTALENNVEEMIRLIGMLRPDIASQVSGMVSLIRAPQFRERIAPVYYRRKREDVLTELPDLIENVEWCTMFHEERVIYENAILSKRYADARRMSWNVPLPNKGSKAIRLLELVEEAKNEGRKIIVFSFFLDTLHTVKMLLGESGLGPITGAVSAKERQTLIDEFDKAAPGTVLISQIISGGVGLNIQSASVVIICEPQFKPSTETQAISRAYRMGQTRNVLVFRLLCEKTIDEKISKMLGYKQHIFDTFADESVAAEQHLEIDEKTFHSIVEEERARISSGIVRA